MTKFKPAAARGTTRTGWLDSRHSFSFGGYRDPDAMQFRSLRVLNDDRVAAGAGFGTHPHRGMEIVTIVLSGGVAHRDSMGHGSTIPAGAWQLMSAGSGVSHSEVNASDAEPTHFLQTWLVSAEPDAAPRYAEARPAGEPGVWEVVAAPDAEGAPLPLRQDARIAALAFGAGPAAAYPLTPGRAAYLFVAEGAATVNGRELAAGDALEVEGEPAVTLAGRGAGRAVLFDLA